MEAVFPKDVQVALDRARAKKLKDKSRLRIRIGERVEPVLRMWKSGFSVEAAAPALRGFVDVYDGSVHQFQCLIVTSEEDAGERRYEFKRVTAVSETPALDFEVDPQAPVGLIEDGRPRSTGDR